MFDRQSPIMSSLWALGFLCNTHFPYTLLLSCTIYTLSPCFNLISQEGPQGGYRFKVNKSSSGQGIIGPFLRSCWWVIVRQNAPILYPADLDFWPMTLNVNMGHHWVIGDTLTKFGKHRLTHCWVIVQTRFSILNHSDLDLWPWILEGIILKSLAIHWLNLVNLGTLIFDL